MTAVYVGSLLLVIALAVIVGWVAHLIVRPNSDTEQQS